MAHATLSRATLIDKLASVFRHYGYEGASLARLARASGLVKASLYYQFPRGKEDMADAVLNASIETLQQEVIAPLANTALSPKVRLKRMVDGFNQMYGGGEWFCVIDVFGIGEAGLLYRERLSAAIAGLTDAIARLLVETGLAKADAARRAEDALISIQGALVLARARGEPAVFRRVLRELPGRLSAP